MDLRLGIVGCGRISNAHGIAAQRIGTGFSADADINADTARSRRMALSDQIVAQRMQRRL